MGVEDAETVKSHPLKAYHNTGKSQIYRQTAQGEISIETRTVIGKGTERTVYHSTTVL